ncbi:MAG: pantetheine-phosphate adenylyltransferase, partial [Nanoarchaeota archaeon]|nr:pantetheine-phosphate adenylyltransferase [Nanoarchaeota archaeon]
LRAVSDFDYEFQMALVNRKLNPDIETIFIMTKDSYVFLSASVIKELAKYNGNITGLVPEIVDKKFKEKFKQAKSIR